MHKNKFNVSRLYEIEKVQKMCVPAGEIVFYRIVHVYTELLGVRG